MEDLTGQVDEVDSITALEWNNFQQEFKNLIATYSGQTMSSGDLAQLTKAIVLLVGSGDHYAGGGTGNAQVLTGVAKPTPPIYSVGMRVRWVPSATNTGNATIDVGGLGAKNIRRFDGSNLQAGDITTGRAVVAFYNGTEFRIPTWGIPASSAALPSGFITGLTFSPSSADLTHDLVFESGQCRDAGNAANLVLASPLTKRFDGASLAVGTGQTGFPTSSLSRSANTWYRVFVVGHTDGRTDVGFDTDAAATNLLADYVSADIAGWTYYRQVGWIKTQTGASDAFVPFVQYAAEPGVFQWVAHVIDVDANRDLDDLLTRQTKSLAAVCPPGAVAEVTVLIEDASGSGTANRYGILADKNQADTTPSSSAHNVHTNTSPGSNQGARMPSGTVRVQVDASSEFYERWDAGGSLFRTLQVPRWRFLR